MKIAFFIEHLGRGGAERVVSILASYMADELNHNVTIYVLSRVREEYIISPKIKVVCLLKKIRRLKVLRIMQYLVTVPVILRRYLKREKYDKIYSFLDLPNLISVLTRFNVFVSVRNSYVKGSLKRYIIDNFIYPFRNVEKIVCISKGVESYFIEKKYKKTCTIYNPVNYIKSVASSNTLSHSLASENYFLAVGRLVPQKNFNLLINAFYDSNLYQEYQLIIAGVGFLRHDLQALIDKLGLKKRVKLVGLFDTAALNVLYKNATATVMSSNFEGFGNVLIESLNMSTPVISTDCPSGPNEIITHEKNGLLVPVGDADALSKAMKRVVNDPELYRKLKSNTLSSIEKFNIQQIADQWLSL